jgi:DNA-binding transcriptional LysR family regulator
MELRQLQHFVAVTQEMNFTRAARRMNIVQSALSASIASLEAELGAKLFHRTTRQVRVSAAGEAFYEKARQALEAVQQARDSVLQAQTMQRGRLTIGTVQSLAAFLDMPGLLADFNTQHPAIEVRLRQDNRLRLAEQVRDGRCDLALLPVLEVSAGLEAALVLDEPMVLVCAPGHPLAAQREVALSELTGERFVDFQPGWGTREAVDAGFAAANVRRVTMFEVTDLETVLGLVVRGMGLALVPASTVADGDRVLSVVPIAGEPVRWRMMAIFLPGARTGDTAPSARAFLDLLDLSTLR